MLRRIIKKLYCREKNRKKLIDTESQSALNKIWATGMQEEMQFWYNWFKEKGGQWKVSYLKRLNPDAIVEGQLANYVRLAQNEAEKEDYQGTHQWNFCIDNNEYIIWNRYIRISIDEFFSKKAATVYLGMDNQYEEIVVLQKIG